MPITFSQPKISERNIFSNVKSKLEILVKQQDLFKTGSNTHILVGDLQAHVQLHTKACMRLTNMKVKT